MFRDLFTEPEARPGAHDVEVQREPPLPRLSDEDQEEIGRMKADTRHKAGNMAQANRGLVRAALDMPLERMAGMMELAGRRDRRDGDG